MSSNLVKKKQGLNQAIRPYRPKKDKREIFSPGRKGSYKDKNSKPKQAKRGP